MIQAHVTQMDSLGQSQSKEEEKKEEVDVEMITKHVAAIETVLIQVLDSLVSKLEWLINTKKKSHDLGDLMTAENSLARSCQLIGLLVCTE